jgi:hypothetical protein
MNEQPESIRVAGAITLAGIIAVSIGLAMMWLPLGIVAAGALLIVTGAFVARSAS